MPQKILILAANPRQDLKLGREIRDLKKVVERSAKQNQFEVEIELAVRSEDLQELFLEYKPWIVHFCGHGTGERGLVLGEEGGEQTVTTEAITTLCKLFTNDINCVVLNACDTDQQAERMVQHINYVIGMNQAILDDAAYFFAVGFYRGLSYGESVERAYALGCNAIELQMNSNQSRSAADRKLTPVNDTQAITLPEHQKPVLYQRNAILSNPTESPPSPEFIQAITKEADLKRYQDQTRAALDEFGQVAAHPPSLTQHEYRQRQVLVRKVKEFWIEGFLKPSLSTHTLIELGVTQRPDAIWHPFMEMETVPVPLDQSFEQLQATSIVNQIGTGKTLLILGEPGAGKTVTLLKLAERLVAQTEQNLSLPIPIVLNLSSWAKQRPSIAEWLVEELREKYQVPKALSKPWIEQEQLILLLDGLDEVAAEYRNACVVALNQFIETHGATEMVVCSRVRDYENLADRLKLRSAICIQPLTTEQVNQFLQNAGDALAGLNTLLQQDAELAKFAETPLILNIMSLTYAGWSAEQVMQQLDSSQNRYQHLFETYIERVLQRRGPNLPYPKDKTLHWLSWLAQRMAQESQTVFLIEKMQPSWLQNRPERREYRIRNFLIGGLIGGLIGWLIVGLFLGLFLGLLLGLLGVLSGLTKIILVEQLSWSWQKAKGWLIVGLSFGLIVELLLGLSDRLIVGLSFGLFLGLMGGLSSTEVENRTTPNQGIRSSAKNGLIVGLSFGLIGGLSFELLLGLFGGPSGWLFGGPSGELIVGLSGWLIGGLSGWLIGWLGVGLLYGGLACIQHFNLRLILYRKGRIPWNYARFLDYAAERLLMKKVGGGYVFVHRMLMEHFAQRDANSNAEKTISGTITGMEHFAQRDANSSKPSVSK
jgi:Cdc6-like AAA superfamily ATPase